MELLGSCNLFLEIGFEDMDCSHLARDNAWWAVVNTAVNFSTEGWEFLD
jgi:hypothetical protein